MKSSLLSSLALAATAWADPITFNQDGMSSSISLVQNGSATDVHMQMWGPSSAGWASVGMGNKMENSLMFVMYPSGNGQGVTVSARTAPGHVMPKVEPGMTTQVSNSSVDPSGMMMAQFICYGCTQWSSGQLSTTSSSQAFIYALGPGQQVMSDDMNADIRQHSEKGHFNGNTAAAYTSPSDTTTNGPLNTPAPAGNTEAQEDSGPSPMIKREVYAHAILASIVFYGLMPLAVILLRLPFLGKASFHLHWMIQTVAFLAAIAALGIALNFSLSGDEFKSLDAYHQIIGIVVICVIVLQPIGGWVHHFIYKKKEKRTAVSWAHMALGWIIIFLGMLNACFGLVLSDNKNAAAGGLGAAGIVILLATAAVSLWSGSRKRKTRSGSPSDKERLESDSDHSK